MNTRQLTKVRKIAGHIAENRIDVVSFEDKQGHCTGYMISIDGHQYGLVESFYQDFPQFHSPYHVHLMDEKWTIIFMEDEDENRSRPVDGEPFFTKRQAAYRRCKELNEWWQSKQAGK
jgi:hypothetical protein